MAIHSSVLVWRIPRTAEPGGLQSMGWWSQTGLSTAQHAFIGASLVPIYRSSGKCRGQEFDP